jgi:hypothetical protein
MNLKKFLIILASISTLFASGYAMAGRHYVRYVYYSDATYTTPVGRYISTCSGSVINYGSVTTFKVLEEKFDCSM